MIVRTPVWQLAISLSVSEAERWAAIEPYSRMSGERSRTSCGSVRLSPVSPTMRKRGSVSRSRRRPSRKIGCASAMTNRTSFVRGRTLLSDAGTDRLSVHAPRWRVDDRMQRGVQLLQGKGFGDRRSESMRFKFCDGRILAESAHHYRFDRGIESFQMIHRFHGADISGHCEIQEDDIKGTPVGQRLLEVLDRPASAVRDFGVVP